MSRISTTGQGYSIDNDPDEFGVIGSDNSAAWRYVYTVIVRLTLINLILLFEYFQKDREKLHKAL